MLRRGDRVMKKKDYLNLLAKSKGKSRRDKLIDIGDKSEMDAVSECVMNALAGNLQLKDCQFKKLQKHAKALRWVAKKSLPLRKKKALLKQSGGILPILLPLALSAVGSLAKGLFQR
jgi:hypothetical protein